MFICILTVGYILFARRLSIVLFSQPSSHDTWIHRWSIADVTSNTLCSFLQSARLSQSVRFWKAFYPLKVYEEHRHLTRSSWNITLCLLVSGLLGAVCWWIKCPTIEHNSQNGEPPGDIMDCNILHTNTEPFHSAFEMYV